MAKRISLIGWTSKHEVRASAWLSEGEETIYFFACNLYANKELAEKVYGIGCCREVRITIQEVG